MHPKCDKDWTYTTRYMVNYKTKVKMQLEEQLSTNKVVEMDW